MAMPIKENSTSRGIFFQIMAIAVPIKVADERNIAFIFNGWGVAGRLLRKV